MLGGFRQFIFEKCVFLKHPIVHSLVRFVFVFALYLYLICIYICFVLVVVLVFALV